MLSSAYWKITKADSNDNKEVDFIPLTYPLKNFVIVGPPDKSQNHDQETPSAEEEVLEHEQDEADIIQAVKLPQLPSVIFIL